MDSRLGKTLLLLALVIWSNSAHASGRIELNQAVVDAAGGFPFVIAQPGNYVLTGPLVVPTATQGLLLTNSEIVIDLNGFSISSDSSCQPGACTSGSAAGISPLSGIAHGHRSAIRNGIVRGFGGDCIRIGRHARIQDMLVTECGGHGIQAGGGSVLSENRIVSTGEEGILLGDGTVLSLYAHNVVADTNLATPGSAVLGGRQSAANSCEDGSCGAALARRFYLTLTQFDGAQAPAACASGFHMASMWEILDPSNLRYDTSRGMTVLDSGSGPPNLTSGWVRTGIPHNVFTGSGAESCNGYSTTSGSGTAANLSRTWDGTTAFDADIPGWSAFASACSQSLAVWCVED